MAYLKLWYNEFKLYIRINVAVVWKKICIRPYLADYNKYILKLVYSKIKNKIKKPIKVKVI